VFMILVVKAHARVIFLGWYVRRPSGYSGIQAGHHTRSVSRSKTAGQILKCSASLRWRQA
jgi:hypothetical protein